MSIVNPNMVQLQNFLKSMSPQEWAHFVQNPSPQVPGLLVSMESERRIKEANDAKNAQAQVPMGTIKDKVNAQAAQLANPTPTGLGSLMAQAPTQQMPTQQISQAPVNMAEGGLAQLDTGDMYNEANFATGGIVAFGGQDGSYVDADGSYEDELGIYQSGLSDTDTELQRLIKAQQLREAHRPTSRNPNAPLVFQGRDQALRPMALESDYPTTQDLSSKIAELQARKEGYGAGVKSYSDLIKAGVKPTSMTDKVAADTKTKGKPAVDMSPQDKLKMANDKYNATADKITQGQTSAYDQAMERLMKIYGEEDPARKQMREEYEKRKGNVIYDVLGDIGAGLSQAKRGREFEAAGAGFKAGQERMAALKKEGKDLTLEDMKAQHELKLLGAKYGFDSEQFKEKLQATRELEKAKMGNELEKANIIYGYKANAFDSGEKVKQDKYVKDWLSGEGKAYAPFITADENAKGLSDKMKAQIVAAKKAHAAKKQEAASRFPTQNYAYGQAGFASTDPLGILQ